MDIETARFIVYNALKGSDPIAQLLVNPLNYKETKTLNEDLLEVRVLGGVIRAIDIINKDIIWAILKEFPELEEEIENTVKRFGKLP